MANVRRVRASPLACWVKLDSGASGTGKTEVVVASLEMLSGRSKKEYAKEVEGAADAPDDAGGPTPPANGASSESDLEAVVAM
jgi:hypothetical protein